MPGESSGTMTPEGVRASVHSTNTRACPCCTCPRVSPTSLVPRSSSTTLPSAPKVSAATMHVVMPGSVESIAVSSVQSMNAPRGRRKRVVGRRLAGAAGVALERSSVVRALSPPWRVRRASSAAAACCVSVPA